MTKTAEIELDPGRLVALDRIRRDARARQRGAADRYAELREKRQDATSRAAMARQRAEELRSPEGREDAAKIDAEIEELTRQMNDANAEADAHSTEVSRAHTLLVRCLRHATEDGMTIPAELAEDAELAMRRGSI